MTKNIEIEFKTVISEEKYVELLHRFNLENNVFKQVNHYFDTDNYDLNAESIVLRIRQKGEDRYKVTLKSQGEKEAYENHVILSKAKAEAMIENGFNTNEFFNNIENKFVSFKISLDNFRASTPFEGGTLFLDRCDYCGTTDYEIEFEFNHYDDGKIIFENFIKTQNIDFLPTKRKSERAFTCTR
ncbi:CYTH domain-containing protein [Mycoplasmatota bacterium]|nr:CYTH domain-containing protein [Mycoplasmatota bacterium]